MRVTASTDDAEESSSGSVKLTSSDLELVQESSIQTVGMRFNGVTIPQGANIVNAYVQFKVDEVTTASTSLTITGEATENATTFVNISGNVSSRPTTSAFVSWSPAPWSTVGEAGPDQQTPDIASVIQEIISQTGWVEGNSLVVIITGTGKRVAESYNGDQAGAPLLHVEYTTGPPNSPPVANDDTAETPEESSVTIDVATNDSDPDGTLNLASTNTTCASCSGPSNGSLVNNGDGTFLYDPNPDYYGADSFVYEICDNNGACDTATVDITVTPVADSPIANDDNTNTPENTPVTIDVSANDTDPDGDLDPTSANTTCAACAAPTNGSLVNNGNGTFDYNPNLDYNGVDSFIYEICDVGGRCATATVYITVNISAPQTLEVRIAVGSDDAEEAASGGMSLGSSDLELVQESSIQTVGIRFNGITIPQGATIISAYVQFKVDETKNTDPTTLLIGGEKVPNASTFTTTTNNITNRTPTLASVEWSPNQWTTVGEAGLDQQTPDIASVIQEIVGQPEWSDGNSLVIIITGEGQRVAESYNGDPNGAPLLHIEYYPGS